VIDAPYCSQAKDGATGGAHHPATGAAPPKPDRSYAAATSFAHRPGRVRRGDANAERHREGIAGFEAETARLQEFEVMGMRQARRRRRGRLLGDWRRCALSRIPPVGAWGPSLIGSSRWLQLLQALAIEWRPGSRHSARRARSSAAVVAGGRRGWGHLRSIALSNPQPPRYTPPGSGGTRTELGRISIGPDHFAHSGAEGPFLSTPPVSEPYAAVAPALFAVIEGRARRRCEGHQRPLVAFGRRLLWTAVSCASQASTRSPCAAMARPADSSHQRARGCAPGE